jgi:hypothetical protein
LPYSKTRFATSYSPICFACGFDSERSYIGQPALRTLARLRRSVLPQPPSTAFFWTPYGC